MTQLVKKHDEGSAASRLACYTAAAGLGSFAFGNVANAVITAVDAPDFLAKSLVGNPNDKAPIENANYAGDFPFNSTGWATEGILYQYTGTSDTWVAYGIDLDGNGSGDINFFRGRNWGGYLSANSTTVGYYSGSIPGSGQVSILSNDTENPDADGSPAPSGSKRLLQGFATGQIIGDGNDVSIGAKEGVMRELYGFDDWDGVPNNKDNLYATGNPGDSSYIGFEITGLSTGTGSGFGWVEVVVREGTHTGTSTPHAITPGSHPELQILGWAFTDDGSPIAAGDTGVILGDLDSDGFVGITDLNVVLGNWNQNVTPGDLLQGDPTGDGFVGIEDLNVVLGNWNAGTPPVANVPEPSALMLLAAGIGTSALRRRRA